MAPRACWLRLPQPGGFQGLGRVPVEGEAYDLASLQRPDRRGVSSNFYSALLAPTLDAVEHYNNVLASLDELLRLGAETFPCAQGRPPTATHLVEASGPGTFRPIDHVELDFGIEHVNLREVATRPSVINPPHDLHVLLEHLQLSISLRRRRKQSRRPLRRPEEDFVHPCIRPGSRSGSGCSCGSANPGPPETARARSTRSAAFGAPR